MRLYLDVCCLNRPFDDQRQSRIRLESEAIRLILKRRRTGEFTWCSSEVVEDEVLAVPDPERRLALLLLIEQADERVELTTAAIQIAMNYEREGLGSADALHLAIAQTSACDILLTTDDDFIRRASRLIDPSRLRVENPVRFLFEEKSP